jgi:hypothetical protein
MKSGTMPSSFVTELHKQGYIAKPIATVQMGNPFGDEKYIGQFVIGDVIANMTQHDFTKHKNNDARQNIPDQRQTTNLCDKVCSN